LSADDSTQANIRLDNDGGAGVTMYWDGIMLEPQIGDVETPSAYAMPSGVTSGWEPEADKTSENTANNANNYTGNSIATSYTADKCTDPDADETATHTARNTTYIDGSVNRSGYGSCEFNNDLKAQGSSEYACYYSSTYKGGLYGQSFGVSLASYGALDIWANSSVDIEAQGGTLSLLGSSYVMGSSGNKFRLHITNASDDGGGWYSYDAYID
jgi:hypothetical protein